MEFGFFKEWTSVGTIRVGKELMKKIMSTSLKNQESKLDVFPEDIPDNGGESIERYLLSSSFRYSFGKDLSEILQGEFHKKIKEEEKNSEILDDKDKAQEQDKDCKSNVQVIVELLSFVVNEEITHFTFG
jgi:hypothetical protein